MSNVIRNIIRDALPSKLVHSYRVLLHLWLRPFERELALISQHLHPDKVAIDVGANVGLIATVLARGSKRVIAFEPHPTCAAHLRRIAIRNCDVVEIAASDRNGIAVLRAPQTHALGTIEPANALAEDPTTAKFNVRIQTLDSALVTKLSSEERVSFVKIDVEGHELAVLKGARGLIDQHKPVLMVEIEYRHGARVSDLFALLESQGYRAFVTCDAATLTPATPDSLKILQTVERMSPPVSNVLFFHSSN